MSGLSQRLLALRRRFVEQAENDAQEIAGGAAVQSWHAVRDLCHRLAGRAGMLGFPELTDDARALEEAVDAGKPSQDLDDLAHDLVRRLRALEP